MIKDSDVALEILEERAKTQVCSCGGRLVVAWGGGFGYQGYVLRCGKDISHSDFIKPHQQGLNDPDLPGWKLSNKQKKEMIREMGAEKTRALMAYQGKAVITRDDANEIISTIWPDAVNEAKDVVKAALMICAQYNLNPLLKHLFLMPFKTKDKDAKGVVIGEKRVWSIALGIRANRILASRQGRYSYFDNTPRMMTDDEQMTIRGYVDQTHIWAITKLRDGRGGEAQGYGSWPKDKDVIGSDKGNTKQNMAMIRSERAALDRLFPDAMPTNVDVVDERFTTVGDKVVDTSSGEVIEGVSTEVAEDTSTEGTEISDAQVQQDVDALFGKAEAPASQSSTADTSIKPVSDRDPRTIKTMPEFYHACYVDFNLQPSQAIKELGYSKPADVPPNKAPADCYIEVRAARASKR